MGFSRTPRANVLFERANIVCEHGSFSEEESSHISIGNYYFFFFNNLDLEIKLLD